MKTIPCKDCITYPICKLQYNPNRSPIVFRFTLMEKCSLIKYYFDISKFEKCIKPKHRVLSSKRVPFIIVSNPHIDKFNFFYNLYSKIEIEDDI